MEDINAAIGEVSGINKDNITVPLSVNMIVQRVSQEVNIRGIGISEFQASQG